MGLLSAALATLTVGYILGVWTACALSGSARRSLGGARRDDRELSGLFAPPIAEVVWISERRS